MRSVADEATGAAHLLDHGAGHSATHRPARDIGGLPVAGEPCQPTHGRASAIAALVVERNEVGDLMASATGQEFLSTVMDAACCETRRGFGHPVRVGSLGHCRTLSLRCSARQPHRSRGGAVPMRATVRAHTDRSQHTRGKGSA